MYVNKVKVNPIFHFKVLLTDPPLQLGLWKCKVYIIVMSFVNNETGVEWKDNKTKTLTHGDSLLIILYKYKKGFLVFTQATKCSYTNERRRVHSVEYSTWRSI